MKIVIVGYGVVGQNLRAIFPDADIHDPPHGLIAPGVDENYQYDIAFISVPTPLLTAKESGRQFAGLNCEYVRQAISEVDAAVYVIKSTIPPGTTDRIRAETGKVIVFSPEYQGETVNANGYEYPFVIIGGMGTEEEAPVAELYKSRFTGEFRIYKTDALTAELAKFMENAFIATKVTFVNEFAILADRLGVDRDELREFWLADPRVSRSHSYAFRGQPYYQSRCLDKDIPGIVAAAWEVEIDMPLLRAVIGTNESRKPK